MKTTSEKIVSLWSIALTIILATAVSAASLSLKVGTVESSETTIEVPITTDRCEGLGAMQFNLSYDPAVIKPVSVESGSELTNGLVEFEIKSPGLLRVAMVSSNPVKGSGELLILLFDRVEKGATQTGLAITDEAAWDYENNTEMLVTSEAGALNLTTKSALIPDKLKMPLIIGAAIAALLIFMILIIVLVKRGSNKGKVAAIPSQVPPAPANPNPSPPSGEGDAFCQNCGSPHNSDAKFCPKCGQAINP